MVAAVHWFNSEEKNFKNFLSWRPSDLFKTRLISYAEKIHSLELDHIESAVLNVLSLIATGDLFIHQAHSRNSSSTPRPVTHEILFL